METRPRISSWQTDDGGTLKLSKLKGKPVVLYFYPKDDTSGCTAEAKDFTCLAADFRKAGAEIIGVSPDSVESHRKFAKKYDLGIRLAADTDKAVATAYGVWTEKSMWGRRFMGVERATFLIDKSRAHRQELAQGARAGPRRGGARRRAWADEVGQLPTSQEQN